jgi:hypothetical protein
MGNASYESPRPKEHALEAVLPPVIASSRQMVRNLGEVAFREVASEHLVNAEAGGDCTVLNYHMRQSAFDTKRVSGDPTFRSLLCKLREYSPDFEPGFRDKIRYERLMMPSVGNFRGDLRQNDFIHARYYLPQEKSDKPAVLIPSFGVRDWQHHFFSLYLASRDYPVLELVLPLNEDRAPDEWRGANRTRRFMLLKPSLADLVGYTNQYCLDMQTGIRFLKQEKGFDTGNLAVLGLSFTATTVHNVAALEPVGKRVLLLGGMSPPLDYVWEEARANEFRSYLERIGVTRQSMREVMGRFIPSTPGGGEILLINVLGDETLPMREFADYWEWQRRPSAVLSDARGFPDAHVYGIYLSPDVIVSEIERFLSGKGDRPGNIRVFRNKRAGLPDYRPNEFEPLKSIKVEEVRFKGSSYDVTHLG